MYRKRRIRAVLSIALPFLLPVAGLVLWLVSESVGQESDNSSIVASIDASGSGTTYLSTVLPDGNTAEWTCSAGTFVESGERSATGRSVTWTPEPGFMDSVTVVVMTSTVSDSVRFLPFIPSLNPSVTISAAYHLAITDRARSISLSSGAYQAVVEDDNLSEYDGIVILVLREPGRGRRAIAAAPGDTLELDLPLGAEIECFGVDHTEDALDNGGSVLITFFPDSTS
jgi:hypothetical protein